ncbi:hypothetical protein BD770DRAFT_404627 [Pilaira anomala]|nr:hypothetical protein BD770DRAFT_404627 [Pilaira anomala]
MHINVILQKELHHHHVQILLYYQIYSLIIILLRLLSNKITVTKEIIVLLSVSDLLYLMLWFRKVNYLKV